MKIQLRLREKLFLFLHLLSAAFAVSADAADDWKLQNLRTELLSEPICIDSAKPLRRTVQANTRHMLTDTPTRERTGWMTWPNALAIFENFNAYSYWQKAFGDWRTSTRDSVVGAHILGWKGKPERMQLDAAKPGDPLPMVGSDMAPWKRRSDLPEQRISNVLAPWEAYIRYGDVQLIRDHYDIARNTLEAILAIRTDGLVPSMVGDWHDAVRPDLDIALRRKRGLERDDVFGGVIGGGYPVHTPGRVCGTVHALLGARALAATARELGREEDAVRYESVATELREAFNRAYYDEESGRYSYTTPAGNTYESQTMYGCALCHDLVPLGGEQRTMQRLLEHIEASDNHFTSGQLGADRVLKALTRNGAEAVAWQLLTAKGYPGFDLMLSYGNQTTWETCGEAILNRTPPDSPRVIMQNRPMDHVQWVAVDSWFFSDVLGIAPDSSSPGYGHFTITPHMIWQMEWAGGGYASLRGWIGSYTFRAATRDVASSPHER